MLVVLAEDDLIDRALVDPEHGDVLVLLETCEFLEAFRCLEAKAGNERVARSQELCSCTALSPANKITDALRKSTVKGEGRFAVSAGRREDRVLLFAWIRMRGSRALVGCRAGCGHSGEFVEAHADPFEVFDFIEEPFGEIPPAVDRLIPRRGLSLALARADRFLNPAI